MGSRSESVGAAAVWLMLFGLLVIATTASVVNVVDASWRRARSWWPVLALVLVACAPKPRFPAAMPHPAFAAAEDGWRQAGLPDPGACLHGARVAWALDDAEYRRRCRREPSASAACWLHRERVAFLSPGQRIDDRGEPVAHEAMHGLQACAGMPVDYKHSDPRVWSAAGEGEAARNRSAQRRAWEVYRGR